MPFARLFAALPICLLPVAAAQAGDGYHPKFPVRYDKLHCTSGARLVQYDTDHYYTVENRGPTTVPADASYSIKFTRGGRTLSDGQVTFDQPLKPGRTLSKHGVAYNYPRATCVAIATWLRVH